MSPTDGSNLGEGGIGSNRARHDLVRECPPRASRRDRLGPPMASSVPHLPLLPGLTLGICLLALIRAAQAACAPAAVAPAAARPAATAKTVTAGGPAPSGVDILATFDGPAMSFELAIDRCGGRPSDQNPAMGDCPMRIRLIAGGKVLDSTAFGEHACGEATPTTADWLFGVASDTSAWSTSWHQCAIGVAARPVRVAPDDLGVLVSQRQGSEHVARKHWLFIGRGGKVVLAWSSDEEGKSDLDVRVVEAPNGQFEDVVVTDVVPVDGDPDEVTERIVVRRLHLDRLMGRVIPSIMPDADFPLYLAYVGPFKSLAAARDPGKARPPTCVIPFGIVPGSLFPGLGLRGYLRGAVLVRREEAEAKKIAAGRCPAAFSPKIIEYVPKVEFSPRTLK
jgi:hypothetical protein